MNMNPDPHPAGAPPVDVLIFGGGGHGKAVIDLLRVLPGYNPAGVIDDSLAPGSLVLGVPVLGGSADLARIYAGGIHAAVNAVGAVANVPFREEIFARLAKAGFSFPTLVHPTAFVEPSAHLADGVQLFPHAYAGSDAEIGFGVILNVGVMVCHDCKIGRACNISPGAMLAGMVTVGARALVGMGATVNIGVQIGEGARVGNGATVKKDVPPGAIVRAGHIWPESRKLE
jgi:sugar O-acyltransferase (sialic acid O-acetyltransferase NeuD family)